MPNHAAKYNTRRIMEIRHKNKALACLLAIGLGWAGAHRFYMYGWKDKGGWAYLLASLVYIVVGIIANRTDSMGALIFVLLPFPLFAAILESLVMGLTDDRLWDQRHNPHSSRVTQSTWPLITVLAVTFALGFTALVAGMARITDLLYTGGAFG